ncbi:hypothetical protein AAFC00_000820 [Neodothiora populina]
MHSLHLALLLPAVATLATAATSSGCGKVSPYKIDKLTNDNIESGGDKRTFLINLPNGYDSNTAAPLIFSFHGNGGNALAQSNTDYFTNETWNPNSIVVYPDGITGWTGAPYHNDKYDDVLFTADMLDQLSSDLCIDTNRVYCAGKSIGGGFCNVLACDDKMSASIAAIAPVSGAFYTTPSDSSFSSNCKPAHQMPILEFHGQDDPIIPYDGGKINGVDLPAIGEWAQDWTQADGCASNPSPQNEHLNNSKVMLAQYSCNGSTNVVSHYSIDGLGHTWPSTEYNLENFGVGTYLDASPLILDFFSKWSLEDNASSPSSSSSSSSASSTATATSSGSGGSSSASASASATSSASSSSSSGGAASAATAFPGLVGALAFGVILL